MVFFPYSLHITISIFFSAWFLSKSFPASSQVPVCIPYAINCDCWLDSYHIFRVLPIYLGCLPTVHPISAL